MPGSIGGGVLACACEDRRALDIYAFMCMNFFEAGIKLYRLWSLLPHQISLVFSDNVASVGAAFYLENIHSCSFSNAIQDTGLFFRQGFAIYRYWSSIRDACILQYNGCNAFKDI